MPVSQPPLGEGLETRAPRSRMSSDQPVDREPGPPSEPGFFRLVIPRQVLASMRESALRQLPEEACGLLIGVAQAGTIQLTRALPVPNVAAVDERTRRFEIDPRAVINVRRELRAGPRSLVGFFHSHPNGASALSPHDLEYARWWPETVWLVVAISEDGVVAGEVAWWLDSAESEPRALEIEVAGERSAACPE
jgi:proteasome lid subunit RPN8/RPN11